MIKSRHIGLVVKSMTKMLMFYTQALQLGLSVIIDQEESGEFIENISRQDGCIVRTVKLGLNGCTILELLEYQYPHIMHPSTRGLFQYGFTHIAFTVDGAVMDQMVQRNFVLKTPQVSSDGKHRVCFCRDPEDNLIEFVEELL